MSRSKPLVQEHDDKKDLYLEDKEVKLLIKTAGLIGRNRERDSAMIQMAYSHGLRASECCGLKWERVNLEKKTVHVIRVKGSKTRQHWLYPQDISALKKLGKQVGYVFKSEAIIDPGPVSVRGFHLIVARAGKAAGLGSFVHPHQLRHACGHRLRLEGWDVLDIQEWLGHVNVQNTQHYAQADAEHFRRLIERGMRDDRDSDY
jgi:type 1 fimbriae regulatory protein FimE